MFSCVLPLFCIHKSLSVLTVKVLQKYHLCTNKESHSRRIPVTSRHKLLEIFSVSMSWEKWSNKMTHSRKNVEWYIRRARSLPTRCFRFSIIFPTEEWNGTTPTSRRRSQLRSTTVNRRRSQLNQLSLSLSHSHTLGWICCGSGARDADKHLIFTRTPYWTSVSMCTVLCNGNVCMFLCACLESSVIYKSTKDVWAHAHTDRNA